MLTQTPLSWFTSRSSYIGKKAGSDCAARVSHVGSGFSAADNFAAVTWICAVSLKTYFVEDNPTIRENLIDTLEELACVTAVGSAETENDGKAWLNLNREKWDLAIVDLFLKQGSGLGVLAACRNRLLTQKVVVLSNYATADIRQRCAQLGVDAVFDKSNEIDALVDFCLQQNCKAVDVGKSSG